MAGENRRNDDQEIVPGMKVEATEGDLGEQDVSPAKVTDVEMNRQGDVEAIKVSKGVLFKKELEVPADRIQTVNSVDADDKSNGTIMIDAKEEELESLTKPGQQTLPPESEQPQDDPLDVLEQQMPTAEGMREMERDVHAPRPRNSFLLVVSNIALIMEKQLPADR